MWQIVLLLRFVPLLPFNVLNYLLSVTPVRLWEYILATWLGMMVCSFQLSHKFIYYFFFKVFNLLLLCGGVAANHICVCVHWNNSQGPFWCNTWLAWDIKNPLGNVSKKNLIWKKKKRRRAKCTFHITSSFSVFCNCRYL